MQELVHPQTAGVCGVGVGAAATRVLMMAVAKTKRVDVENCIMIALER